MMKKIRMFLILLLTAALAFPAAFAEDGSTGADTDSASSLDMKSFPFYTEGSGAEPFAAAFPLYFADGVDDLPDVDIRSVLTILNAAVGTDIFNGAELTGDFDPEDETVTIRLGSGDSVLWFDFAGQRAAYSQFETYCKNRDDAMLDSEVQMRTFLRFIASEPSVGRAAIMIDSSHFQTIETALNKTPEFVSVSKFAWATANFFWVSMIASFVYFNDLCCVL